VTFGYSPEFTETKNKETQTTQEKKLNPAEEKMKAVERNLTTLIRQQKYFDQRKTRQNEGEFT